jgi:hypothetical protein
MIAESDPSAVVEFRQVRELLAPVYARFTEGFGTADLKAAQTLLEALH